MPLAGLATYILFPAAPPWMAAEEGLLSGVHRTTAKGWEVLDVGTAALFSHGQEAVNQVAAVPSLHSAFVALVAIFLWPRVRPALRPLLLLYPLAMGLTLMATGEHYFFDVAARLALRRRRDGRLGLVGTAPAPQEPSQRRLERVDRLDRQRVDAAGRGQLERDQVAEHHRRRAAGRRASRPRSRTRDDLGAAGARSPRAVSSKRRRRRGLLLGVLEHDHREARALGHAGPAADLVVVGLGQLGEEGLAASRSR